MAIRKVIDIRSLITAEGVYSHSASVCENPSPLGSGYKVD